MRYKKVDHIGIAVDDIERVAAILRDRLGMPCDGIQEYPQFQVKVAFFPIGETLVELLQGTAPDAEMTRYVAEKGTGIHHICLEVEGMEAMLDELHARGVPLVDRVPRWRDERTKFAFLAPQGAGGFTIELYEKVETGSG